MIKSDIVDSIPERGQEKIFFLFKNSKRLLTKGDHQIGRQCDQQIGSTYLTLKFSKATNSNYVVHTMGICQSMYYSDYKL
ncbi:hypothetical protein SS50377_28494 [Spironucleus salmonicida]|uniref:Uncharacterized protein n=1 Tax=Spironucleus salmonicida TaxID=348837 RepID=A0A9P8RUI2_9EUKA|nr:hypothetical protein SS50377_28494 [Spironucleus salmonicida]